MIVPGYGFSGLCAISSYMNTMMFSSFKPPFFSIWYAWHTSACHITPQQHQWAWKCLFFFSFSAREIRIISSRTRTTKAKFLFSSSQDNRHAWKWTPPQGETLSTSPFLEKKFREKTELVDQSGNCQNLMAVVAVTSWACKKHGPTYSRFIRRLLLFRLRHHDFAVPCAFPGCCCASYKQKR